ncbi:Mv-ORF87 peptide [Maruca vitrata nucleopolyhedrovirus]|uniref:Mv-ORF87 peptide n=1 Tax=Maruca vitrata nucleopolyhedrovirus TaxID=1307954 RepID=A1YRE9_9ABAC|nr:Mv-ORF87 peptide [Maruca vitrata nucleopolyhedrovirus]ABL76039.1 Mv-ORF87 peptide [Maruca vitrata nucleopolyhedrovirus]
MEYSVQHFYNNNRKPLKPTTLHDGNIKKSLYEDVTYIRKLTCKEIMPGKNDHKFNSYDSNKENQRKLNKYT